MTVTGRTFRRRTDMTFDEFLAYAAGSTVNGGSGEWTVQPKERPARWACVECEGRSGNTACPDCLGTGLVEE